MNKHVTSEQHTGVECTAHSNDKPSSLRAIPSVHQLVESPTLAAWANRVPRPWLVNAAREVLGEYRHRAAGAVAPAFTDEQLAEFVIAKLAGRQDLNLRPVINATGIILHTGLGRAPLADSVVSAMAKTARQYANVELDLETGRRGQRVAIVHDLVCELCDSEAAAVVNNNAAATLIVLGTLAKDHHEQPAQIVVSRGELIEIGGSFRLPQIMQASGAVLREIGTTNKTRIGDYEEVIGSKTAALLKVHTSNYRVVGFTESVPIESLVKLGRRHHLPVVDDIGSGAMCDFSSFGLVDEPTVKDSIAAGADLVLFSGDKLLGGPQAGIIVGKKKWIEAIASNPLMRALRVDKFTLAAMEATLRLHADPQRARRELPVLAMAAMTVDQLQLRADNIADALKPLAAVYQVHVEHTTAQLGGGSLPTQGLESVALVVRAKRINETELSQRLRTGDPPVIPRTQDGAIWLDLRTVFPEQDQALIASLQASAQDGRDSLVK